MNGRQFVRAVRKLARKKGLTVTLRADRGKGGHQMLQLSNGRWTTVKTGELSTGLFRAMCDQLGFDPDEL